MDTPPPGWVTDTALTDHVLRVVSAGGGTTGGTRSFSSVFTYGSTDGHSLSEGQMPNHSHGVGDGGHSHNLGDPGHGHGVGDPGHAHTYRNRINNNNGGGSGNDNTAWGDSATNASGANIGIAGSGAGMWIDGTSANISIYGAGGGEAHSHGLNLDIAYINAVVAVKS